MGVNFGALGIVSDPSGRGGSPGFICTITSFQSWPRTALFWRQDAIWPRCDLGALQSAIFIPLWILAALLAGPAVWALHRDRPAKPGCCRRCGYDLTGNISGVCPECGMRAEGSPRRPTASVASLLTIALLLIGGASAFTIWIGSSEPMIGYCGIYVVAISSAIFTLAAGRHLARRSHSR
jgi:hypothetical protein